MPEPHIPDWLRQLVAAAAEVRPEQLSRFLPPPDGGRDSAVLVLFGEGAEGPDVLLIQRAERMSNHAGQPAFPGGGAEPGDAGPVDTALREAAEEVGVARDGVEVIAVLPALHIPVSGYVVTPVVGWWREPSPVRVVDPAEVARVERVPVAELVDPAHRCTVRHPSGHTGPGFEVRGMLVWGFTAGLLDRVFDLAGWTQPWDRDRVRELPPPSSAAVREGRVPPPTDRRARSADAVD
jgi:8-oxo-dGTP pyrophosphatase MutT (NUDIX family)